jgi:hypothetical protein
MIDHLVRASRDGDSDFGDHSKQTKLFAFFKQQNRTIVDDSTLGDSGRASIDNWQMQLPRQSAHLRN